MNKREAERTQRRLRKELELAEQNFHDATQRLEDFVQEICPFKEGDKFHYITGSPNQDFSGIITEVGINYARSSPGYRIRARRCLCKPTKEGREYVRVSECVKPEFIKVYRPASPTK
jgi:hypothetical protein